MPILRRIVWSVFEIVDFSPGFDYVINWFLGAHGTLPERRAKYFDGAKAPTTQGSFTALLQWKGILWLRGSRGRPSRT